MITNNDKPIVIDVIGSATYAAKKTMMTALIAAYLILVSVLLLAAVLGSVALFIITFIIVGLLIGVVYRKHPILTSVSLFTASVFGLYILAMAGAPFYFFTAAMASMVLYGLLILPPDGVDLKDPLRIDNPKLYALSTLGFTFMSIGGIILSLGIWFMLTAIPQAFFWVFVVLAIGIRLTAVGIKYAYRQKEYIIDPQQAIKNWKNAKNNKVKQQRAAKAKIIRQTRAKARNPKVPTPAQVKLGHKILVASKTFGEMKNMMRS